MKLHGDFERYRRRLTAEGILKSVLLGFTAGFAAAFITALVCWLAGYNVIWVAIGTGLGVACVAAVLLYFFKFAPTTKQAARRIDALGLDERMITMVEFENSDDFMAGLQRQDAKEKLAGVQAKSIKLSVSRLSVVLLCVTGALAVAMTCVCGLAALGIVPGGDTLFPGSAEEYLEVTYMVDEGGEIEGEAEQLLMAGENTTPVQAVADEGWIFIGWDDGRTDPFRYESDVHESVIITAIFESMEDLDIDPDPAEGDVPGDNAAQDAPGAEGEAGQAGGEGSAEGSKGDEGEAGDGDGGDGDSEQSEGHGKGEGAGGHYEEKNQVIDGETYYRDELEEYARKMQEKLESDEELTPEEREFIEKYFGSL